MIGSLFVVIIISASFAFMVDRWLCKEEKFTLVWRLVPALTYIGFVTYSYYRFGLELFWVKNLFLLTLFLSSTVCDIKKQEIPVDFYAVFLLPIILMYLFTLDYVNLLVGLAVFVLMYALAKFTKEAIGYGDAIFVALIFLLIGYKIGSLIFLVAMMISGFLSLILLVIVRANKKNTIPFLPFLALTYLIYLLI